MRVVISCYLIVYDGTEIVEYKFAMLNARNARTARITYAIHSVFKGNNDFDK